MIERNLKAIRGGMDDLIPLVAERPAPVNATQSGRDEASLAASELKAMLDVLNGAAASNMTLFGQILETYAATMMDKIQVLCGWFGKGQINTGFRVRLNSFTDKDAVTKAVRDHVVDRYQADGKMGLADAKELVESAPSVIEVFDRESDASNLADALKAAHRELGKLLIPESAALVSILGHLEVAAEYTVEPNESDSVLYLYHCRQALRIVEAIEHRHDGALPEALTECLKQIRGNVEHALRRIDATPPRGRSAINL